MRYGQIRHVLMVIAAILVVIALFNWATGFRSPLLATVAAIVAIVVIVLEVRHAQSKTAPHHPHEHSEHEGRRHSR